LSSIAPRIERLTIGSFHIVPSGLVPAKCLFCTKKPQQSRSAISRRLKQAEDATTLYAYDLLTSAHLRGGAPSSPHQSVGPAQHHAVTASENGALSYQSVPPETVSLWVRLKGYRLSEKNRGADCAGGRSVEARIDGDLYGVGVVQEPEQIKTPDRPDTAVLHQQPRP